MPVNKKAAMTKAATAAAAASAGLTTGVGHVVRQGSVGLPLGACLWRRAQMKTAGLAESADVPFMRMLSRVVTGKNHPFLSSSSSLFALN